MKTPRLSQWAALILCALSGSSASAGLQSMATSNGAAPVPGHGNAYYSSFYDPGAGPSPVFRSFVSTPDYSFVGYVDFYRTAAGPVATLAMPGQLAPGCGGATFGSVSSPIAGAGGQVLLDGTLTGAGVTVNNMEGLFAGPPGDLHLLVRRGDTPAGAPGTSFYTFTNYHLNGNGDAAFTGQLQPGAPAGTEFGVWSTVGGMHLVARKGNATPIPGVNFGSVLGPPTIGGAGVAVMAQLTGTGVVSGQNDMAIFSDVGGALHVVSRDGDAAPGVAGYVYANQTTIDPPSINQSGQTAFVSFLTRADKQPGVNYGLFLEAPGAGVHNVVVTGQPAPGTGGIFSPYGGLDAPLLNNAGQIAFRATVSNGTSSDVIYRVNADGSGLTPAFLDNVPAPGIGGGVTYRFFYEDFFNDLGQVATVAGLSNGKRGLFATQPDGTQVLIAYEGQQVEIAPGVSKTINLIYWPSTAGTTTGLPTLLDDRGEITFRAVFTDSTSAILVSDAVASPEPASLALLAAGGLLLWGQGRRRRVTGSAKSGGV